MNKQFVIWILVAGLQFYSVGSGTLFGQWYVGPRSGRALGYGYAVSSGYAGAQTAFSANATGMGNLVRSEGAYNEETSQAMVNYERARGLYIENAQKATAGRLALKQMAEADRAKRNEASQVSRAKVQEFQATHRPQPLLSSQLDPSTGRVHWPVALKATNFDDLRRAIDTAFEERAKSGTSSELSSRIYEKTSELKDALRAKISQIPLHEYSESRRFLDSMSVTANDS